MTNAVVLAQAGSNNVTMRNRIINGGMVVAQRGTSFTNVSNGSTANAYTLDRWYGYRSTYATGLNISQQTGFGGQQYCLRAQRANGTTSTASIGVGQIIESVNLFDLQGQPVTFSFWLRVGSNYSGGQISVNLNTGTVADQGLLSFISGWTGSSYPISQNITATTTATLYTFTGTIPSNALEIDLQFAWNPTGTAGANDYVEITGLQLEKGTTATPFEQRLYGQEFLLCQRYFQSYSYADGSMISTGASGSASVGYLPINLCVPMRTAPSTITLPSVGGTSGTFTVLTMAGGYPSTYGTIVASAANPTNFRLNVNGFTGLYTGGGVAMFLYSTGTTTITASAEL